MNKYKYHIIYWCFFYIFYCVSHFSVFTTEIYGYSLLVILVNTVLIMIPFYVVLLYLIPIFGEKKEYFTFIFLFFLSVVVSFLIGVILFKYLDAPKGDNSAEIPDLQTFFFFLNCGIITLPSAFAFIYVEKNKREIEVQRQIEQKNFLLEQANKQLLIHKLIISKTKSILIFYFVSWTIFIKSPYRILQIYRRGFPC